MPTNPCRLLNTNMTEPKIVTLVKRLGELKKIESEIKAELKGLTVDLYMAMSKVGTDTVGTNELGKATAVYKTSVILTLEGQDRVKPLDEEISTIKYSLEVKETEREEIEKKLIMEVLGKEDRQFSFIKYTAPKKEKEKV